MKNRILSAFMALVMILGAIPFYGVHEVRAAEPWQNAYAEVLRNLEKYITAEMIEREFALRDFNADGIPELIFCRSHAGPSIFSFMNGEVVNHGGFGFRAYITVPNYSDLPGIFVSISGSPYYNLDYYTIENNELVSEHFYTEDYTNGDEPDITKGRLYNEDIYSNKTNLETHVINEANIATHIYGWSSPTSTTPTQNNAITVTINNIPVNFTGQAPAIINGRTLVPVRGVFETLGFNVSWSEQARQATLSRANDKIVITIDSATFSTNGASRTLDVPAQIIGGSTMLPIRAVLESVGYGLGWDEATRTVMITTN